MGAIPAAAELARSLGPALWAHSRGTAELAATLAQRHGLADPEAAHLIGMLHDLAKPLARARQRLLARKARPPLDAGEENAPALWHAPAAAVLARGRFGIRRRDILAAIRFHTTAPPGNGYHLTTILMVADYCEPNRDFRRACGLRRLALRDFGRALQAVMEEKLEFLERKRQPAHPRAVRFFERLLEGRSRS